VFIEIENLKPEPLHIRHVYGMEDLFIQRDDAALEEPVSAEFTLTHKDRDLHVRGTVTTLVRCQCARCLNAFIRSVASDFELFYLPHPEHPDPEEEIELKYEDLNVGFYDGSIFDVDTMVLEQIELSMPMRLICKESCKGLCPNCGRDLNLGSCLCKHVERDPRLAVLQEFRDKMDRRRDQ
jgi:uncharacterized protein